MAKAATQTKKQVIINTPLITNTNTLGQLAFDSALQANIIYLVSTGKIIMANHAACTLLGYSEKSLLNKSIPDIFNVTEASFKKMVKQRAKAGKAIATIMTAQKSGKLFPGEIGSAVFTDKNGKAHAIISITDMSERILKQLTIDSKKTKIVAANIGIAKSKQKKIDTKKAKIVADNIDIAKSRQKEIDIKKEKIVANNIDIARSRQNEIDIKKDKIVANNIIIARSKQKKIDIKKDKTVADNIDTARSKQNEIDIKKDKIVANNIIIARSNQKKIDIKKDKIVADNIIIARSNQKKIDIKKDKIVADNIILAQAKSDEEKLLYENYGRNKLLAEIEENFKIMFNSSSDVLFDSDLVANRLVVNDAYENEFGYTKKKNILQANDWSVHIHPDDKKAVLLDYHRMILSTDMEWKSAYRFVRADHSVANVFSSRVILRNVDGKAYRMIGSMQDISKQKVLEEKLEQEIKLKEKQIAEASEDAKDAERSDIGKELHDNVNQLLGVSKLYLDMAKQGGDNSKMYLSRSSEYTMKAIEEIRKLTKAFTADTIRDLGLCEAIENIARETMEINPVKIAYTLKSFIEKSVNDKFKLNMLRIVQEQLNNIIKHAKATNVSIVLLQDKKSIRLTISDNGVGFDTNKKRKGIGVANIKSRAETYNGIADFISHPGNGCVLNAIFPVKEAGLKTA